VRGPTKENSNYGRGGGKGVDWGEHTEYSERIDENTNEALEGPVSHLMNFQ